MDADGNQVTGVFLDSLVSRRISDTTSRRWSDRRCSGWRTAASGTGKSGSLKCDMNALGPWRPSRGRCIFPRRGPGESHASTADRIRPSPSRRSSSRRSRRPRSAARASTCSAESYPLGAQATVSATHWDARVAVIDTSPLRLRRVFGDPNPPNLGQPAAIHERRDRRRRDAIRRLPRRRIADARRLAARRRNRGDDGGPRCDGWSPSKASSHSAIRASQASGCTTRSTRAWGSRDHVRLVRAGVQALAPRWFVAGRVERINTTLPLGTAVEQDFKSNEQTLGFRLTPEITLRVSHRMREPFGRTTWDHRARSRSSGIGAGCEDARSTGS